MIFPLFCVVIFYHPVFSISSAVLGQVIYELCGVSFIFDGLLTLSPVFISYISATFNGESADNESVHNLQHAHKLHAYI